ncbi:MAG: carboxymuconolactone decarboxylase family protein [Polyangiaceae bacterium]|nr:carboxymuconolactone decarboxylase family protein [Polyangiaceae bacterium]
MTPLETLRESLPEPARDVRLNLGAVLGDSSLNAAQKWGVALAAALASRNAELARAVRDEAAAQVPAAVLEDAAAAAALMAMNNVFYRFRHMVGKESYGQLRAGLRMNRIARPAADKIDFELMSLAVSAVNGCEQCIRSHERAVLEGGLDEQRVHDAVRVAAVVVSAAVALECRAIVGVDSAAPALDGASLPA